MKAINNILVLFLVVFAATAGMAQEYKLNMSSGVLKFSEVHKLTIEATSGNEVIFSATGDYKLPERAEGLRPVNSMGMQDNTGVGLAVKKNGDNEYLVTDVMKNSGRYVVKVPKGVKVMIEQNSVHGSKVVVSNVPNDLEISTRYSEVELKNITGSALINTVHGGVNAEFTTLTAPVSIVSAHGHVDVSLPASTKAEIKLSSKWGDIFTNFDIQFDNNESMRQVTSAVNGKINGGGTEVYLESTHGNIYLRKK